MAYTLHQRAEWLQFGARGMSGPSQAMSSVRGLVIHYNGGNANLAGGDARYAQVIASMNDGYWSSRGYALGYSWMCAPDGDLWISRGTDIRCAANGCQEINVPWVAIQVTTTSIEAEPTSQQLDALKNQWVPTIRGWYGNDLAVHVVGHRDINPMCSNPTGTICPGPRLYPRVQAGFFDTPGLPPPPTGGTDDVAFYWEDGAVNYTTDAALIKKRTWPAGATADFVKSVIGYHFGADNIINMAAGTAAEQATRRATIASIPEDDKTSDDAAMAGLLTAVNTRAPDSHLEEVEQLVRLIPTTPTTPPPGGTIAPSEAQVRAWVKAELDARAQRELNG